MWLSGSRRESSQGIRGIVARAWLTEVVCPTRRAVIAEVNAAARCNVAQQLPEAFRRDVQTAKVTEASEHLFAKGHQQSAERQLTKLTLHL